jgi:amino acid adenylation domain-containing protein
MPPIPRSKSLEYIPLSSGQIPFYTGQRLNPDAPIYNMPFAFDLYSKIEVEQFKKAFQLLVDKTDILRTVFQEVDGVPYQYILETYDYQLAYSDFTDYDDESMSEWLEEEAKKMLSFDRPLFEARIIKRKEDHYIWYLNQHHLITDAWACTILFRNCMDLYHTLLNGVIIDPEPYPSYKNFVENLKSEENVAKLSKVAGYWDIKYKNLPEIPRFYGKQNKEITTISKRVEIKIGESRSKKIRNLAQLKELRSWTPDATYFNFFSTILYLFLNRISQSEDISIDIPFHNRRSAIDKLTAGTFIEMFPFQIQFSAHDTFLDIYKKARIEINDVFKNIEKGASIHKNRKSASAVLNYINADFKKFDEFEFSSEWIHSGHVDPVHKVRLQVYDFDSAGDFKLYVDLNQVVFDNEKNEFVPEQFLNLIDHFITDMHQRIGKQPIIAKKEEQLLQSLSKGKLREDIDPDYVLKQFEKNAVHSPDKVAIKDISSRNLTFEQLDQLSNQFANSLEAKGIGIGHTVAFYTYRSTSLIIGILGTLKAGATFVPISSNTPKDRVRFILEDSNAVVMVSHDDLTKIVSVDNLPILSADHLEKEIAQYSTIYKAGSISGSTVAYMIYTSGTTGNPKGVKISRSSLCNYIQYARETYARHGSLNMPLYSMIGFDLTITSIFLPLVTSGTIHIFKEQSLSSDLSILDVIKDQEINIIKLTPSHWDLISDFDFSNSKVDTLIVGGEAFKPVHLLSMHQAFPKTIDIFNEYGPTEATVGCIVYKVDPQKMYTGTVPIGSPIENMECFILDESLNQVPIGVVGQLFLAGKGLAVGYQNNSELTQEKFIVHHFDPSQKMYATGDFCKYNEEHQIEYLGRKDEQVKIRGVRVELGEIESVIANLDGIENCAVTYSNFVQKVEDPIFHCKNCGLPSNFPDSTFDDHQVCNLCNSFESYQDKASKYFKTEKELRTTLKSSVHSEKKYDCMMLLSGGKDSSYALGQLVDMGLNVLAFTLDNGYISEEAKANVRRVVKDLKVDHIFGQTEAMNAIFVDSLKQFSNVCNGCFKVLYTLSTQLALEKGIPFIVTGLSRGQFFETRLTEELFWKDEVDFQKIDDIILNARKAYHRIDDAVAHYLDTKIFASDDVFEKVQFLDFYRYCDVSMDEMMEYLNTHLPWIRPSDTGRSTNCLINQVGIYVHKKKKGFSNYAFPYSWDVRLGHKNRDAALDEINEELNETEIYKIMSEIGYSEDLEPADDYRLTLHYTGKTIDQQHLIQRLKSFLPTYLIPTHFVHLEELPLSKNGKIDRKALHQIVQKETLGASQNRTFTKPDGPIEEILVEIWQDVIGIDKISTSYNFLEIGGNSLAAIRINSRIAEAMNLEIPIASIFDNPTITELGAFIESRISELLTE